MDAEQFKCQGYQPKFQVDLVKFLLRRGANPNATSPRGNTFLMEAAGAGHVAMVEACYHMFAREHYSGFDFGMSNGDGVNLMSMVSKPTANPRCREIISWLVQEGKVMPVADPPGVSSSRGKLHRRPVETQMRAPFFSGGSPESY